jgi:hypothetical protein
MPRARKRAAGDRGDRAEWLDGLEGPDSLAAVRALVESLRKPRDLRIRVASDMSIRRPGYSSAWLRRNTGIRVARDQDSRVCIYQGTHLPGYAGTERCEYPGTRAPGAPGNPSEIDTPSAFEDGPSLARALGYRATQIPGFLATVVSETSQPAYPGSQRHGHPETRLFECPATQEHRYPGGPQPG